MEQNLAAICDIPHFLSHSTDNPQGHPTGSTFRMKSEPDYLLLHASILLEPSSSLLRPAALLTALPASIFVLLFFLTNSNQSCPFQIQTKTIQFSLKIQSMALASSLTV